MNEKEIISKVQGCLMGVCIGDGMFVPWEMYTPERILEATGGIGVNGFQEAPERRFHEMRALSLGVTSDDWAYTKVVAQSLIHCGRLDLMDCAKEHVRAFVSGDIPGMGGTTRRGLESLRGGRDPYAPPPAVPKGKSGGGGNGIVMKISPLALFFTLHQGGFRPEPLCTYTRQLGNLTHPDPRAWIAAYAVGAVIASALSAPITSEKAYSFLEWLIVAVVDPAERWCWKELKAYDILMSTQLERILCRGLWDDPERLREDIGTRCIAIESVPFSITTFLRHPTDFRAGVLEAGNAGGDTDSNASMVGAMIGANVGLEAIPEEWRNYRPEYAEALKLGEELYRAAAEKD